MIDQQVLLDALAKELGVLQLNVQIYKIQFDASQENNVKLNETIKDLHLRTEKKDEDIKNMRNTLKELQTKLDSQVKSKQVKAKIQNKTSKGD